MLTGKKEAVYRGQAGLGDYVCGEVRGHLTSGKVYDITCVSNFLGSIVIAEIEADGMRLIGREPQNNDSSAFRYHLKEGFDADWIII